MAWRLNLLYGTHKRKRLAGSPAMASQRQQPSLFLTKRGLSVAAVYLYDCGGVT